MLKDIYVVDNVFSEPDKVVEWANTFEYLDNTKTNVFWKGKRTAYIQNTTQENIEKSKTIVNEILHNCIANAFVNFKYEFNWEGSTCFHRIEKDCYFENTWVHQDIKCIYAGVVYLHKNPLINSGTMIYKQDNSVEYIENVYNRLVLYKSNLNHSAMGGFGEGDNSRLTFTLFLSKLELKLINDLAGVAQ